MCDHLEFLLRQSRSRFTDRAVGLVAAVVVVVMTGCNSGSAPDTNMSAVPESGSGAAAAGQPVQSAPRHTEPVVVPDEASSNVDAVTAIEAAPAVAPSAPEAVVTDPPAAVAITTSETDPAPAIPASEPAAAPAADLEAQLSGFAIPPDWVADVRPQWDTSKPWKEARQEIRRLLGKGDDASRREGIRLTWDYLQKNDIGDGHEYGMYMFLGGEPLWAIKVYREWLDRDSHSYPPFFGVRALASLYSEYGQFAEAEKLLQRGVTMRPPKREWYEMREAEMHDSLGDLYVAWDKPDQARTSYEEAVRLYPLGRPPYGRHLLPRRAKKVQSKLDLLAMRSLADTSLRDGQYREQALGYSGDINLTIQVTGGRIADIGVQHQEKIDQNACVLIPERIIEQQSLVVDGISGATVTKDAIVGGTLRALKKAGL